MLSVASSISSAGSKQHPSCVAAAFVVVVEMVSKW